MTESNTAAAIKINFTASKWATNNAISEIKAAGGRYDAATKTWIISEATAPKYVIAKAAAAGMTLVEYVLDRATNSSLNTAAELV